jgi:hypothetical protein
MRRRIAFGAFVVLSLLSALLAAEVIVSSELRYNYHLNISFAAMLSVKVHITMAGFLSFLLFTDALCTLLALNNVESSPIGKNT